MSEFPATIRLLGRPKDPEKAKIYDEARRGLDRIDVSVNAAAYRFTSPLERVADAAVFGVVDAVLDATYDVPGVEDARVYVSVFRDALAELRRIPQMAVIDPLAKLVRQKVRDELAPQTRSLNAIVEAVAEVSSVELRDWSHQPMHSTVVVVDPFTRMTIGLETLDYAEKAVVAAIDAALSGPLKAIVGNPIKERVATAIAVLRTKMESEAKADASADDSEDE